MPQPTKIATCCYCGTRAALILNGKIRHELSCSACGAPLHDLKMLRIDKLETDRDKHAASAKPRFGALSSSRHSGQSPKKTKKQIRSKPRKQRKSGVNWFLKEAFDAIEDLLD